MCIYCVRPWAKKDMTWKSFEMDVHRKPTERNSWYMLQSFGAVVMSCVQTFKGGREELHRDLWIIYHVFGEYKWIHLIIAEGLWETQG